MSRFRLTEMASITFFGDMLTYFISSPYFFISSHFSLRRTLPLLHQHLLPFSGGRSRGFPRHTPSGVPQVVYVVPLFQLVLSIPSDSFCMYFPKVFMFQILVLCQMYLIFDFQFIFLVFWHQFFSYLGIFFCLFWQIYSPQFSFHIQ